MQLEVEANASTADASVQNAYLRELKVKQPLEVISRFESGLYGHDKHSLYIYLECLGRVNRLHQLDTAAVLNCLPKARGGSAAGSTAKESVNVKLNSWQLFKYHIFSIVGGGLGLFLFWTFVGTIYEDSTLSKTMMGGRDFKPEPVAMTGVTFEDVKGCEEAKHELEEIVTYLQDPSRFTRMGGKLPRGVLLMGPPGTGKTLLAKAVAGEAGVPFYYSSGSEFEEMYVGVGARRIRDLFKAAKGNTPCIIFIDEVDAIGGRRNDKQQSAMRMTLNQLLVELDGFDENDGVIVIAATNFPSSLDKALTRPGRFDVHVTVPLPDVKGRTALFDHYLAQITTDSTVDSNVLARGTSGVSGADIHNLVNSAAVKASVDGASAVTMKYLEWAKDKILMGPARKSAVIPEKERRNTAFHEGDHALVALCTKGAMPVHKATIMPRGQALGYVSQLPDDDVLSMSYEEMLARLDVCMGGRVAEELIFGKDKVTSGASNDLQQATKLARAMVTQYGFSTKVGPVHYESIPQDEISTDTKEVIDLEVRSILAQSYGRVWRLLTSHKKELHKIANALLDHETLSGAELQEVLSDTLEPPTKEREVK